MAARTPRVVSYSADAPITKTSDDRFRRAPFARAIAETIRSRRDPTSLAIGIYGPWGDGKSTVLNFLAQELEAHSDIVVISFNPWRFGDEASLLSAYFRNMATRLDGSLESTGETIAAALKDYVKYVPKIGEAAKELATKWSTVGLDELKTRTQKLLDAKGKRIVVLMDDIDRMETAEIQAVFRLIKLTADFNHMVYVLAFDQAMVAAALDDKYGSRPGAGQGFLEKIIQIPLHLPKIPLATLSEFCMECVKQACRSASVELVPEERELFHECFELFKVRLHTPRQCKRLQNALTFAFHLLRGEVSPVDLMVIEAARVTCPSLYEAIRSNRDLFLGTLKGGTDESQPPEDMQEFVLKKGLEPLDPVERAIFTKLTRRLFPSIGRTEQLKGFGQPVNLYDRRKDYQMIASPRYFDRYFTYAVPISEIPDSEIAGLLSGINERTVKHNTELIRRLIHQLSPASDDAFITQVAARPRLLQPQLCGALARAIVPLGGQFRGVSQHPFADAVLLIRQLVLNAHDELGERLSLAKAILQEAEPVLFGYYCAEAMRTRATGQKAWSEVYGRGAVTDEDSEPLFVLSEWENGLKQILAVRMRGTQNDPELYRQENVDEAVRRVEAWLDCEEKQAVREAFSEAVRKEPRRAISIIRWYIRDSSFVMMEKWLYGKITAVVDPAVLVDSIKQLTYDGTLRSEGGGESEERRLADAFLRILAFGRPGSAKAE